ncbi:MAG: ABC transporter substrate-binding protein [Acidimicrobiia bacterium]|nr:ABC transporter substrate-binding protein [Acidimicrobiia bacterium]MDH3397956.1 ABC transporter substrate-binding protein [Acidimicrobiia bacterium]
MRRPTVCFLALGLLVAACASPITVDSDAGQLTLDERPERIVSLSATHTEILYAIDAASFVVATDLTSNYPIEAEATTKVDAFNFNVEEIAAVEPDLVVTGFNSQGELDALQAVGIPVLLLAPAANLEDAYEQIEILGDVTGREAEAANLISSMQTRIDALIGSTTAEGLTVFHEIDNTLFSANSSTFLGDIYRRLGLSNIADAVPDEFASGYVQIAEEYLFSRDPDLILLGDAGFGESFESVGARPGWGSLSAVQNGAVFELDGDVAGRWGPRTVDLVEDIVAAIEAAS